MTQKEPRKTSGKNKGKKTTSRLMKTNPNREKKI